MPFQYTTPDNRFAGTIGSLIARQGEIQAQAAREAAAARAQAAQQTGQIWSSAVQGVGQNLAGAIQHAQDPQVQMARMQLDQAKAGQVQDAALRRLFSGSTPPPPEAVYAIVGPERGEKIITGLQSLQKFSTQQVTDARTEAGRVALGLKALSPEMRAAVWPHAREAIIKGGFADESHIPQQPDDKYIDAIAAWGTGKEPGFVTLNPGDVRVPENQPATNPKPLPPPTYQHVNGHVGDEKDRPYLLRNDGVFVDPSTMQPVQGKVESPVSAANAPQPDMNLSEQAIKFVSEMGLSGKNVNDVVPSFSGKAGAKAKADFIEGLAKQAGTLGLTGHDVAAILTDSKAKQAAYTQAQKIGTQTQINESNAKKNFAQLEGLAAKLDSKTYQTSIPILNEWIRSGVLKTTGDADVNNFMGVLTTTLTEYAKVVSGSTGGAGVSVNANEHAQALLSKGLNASTIRSFRVQAEREMGNRVSSYDDALKGLFGNIKGETTSTGGLGGAKDVPTLSASSTHEVTQNGVRYRVTTDAAGKVISAEVIK